MVLNLPDLKFIFVRLPIIIIASIWIGCSAGNGQNEGEELSQEDFMLIEINNEYSMLIPKYMKEASNLNEDASLQYQNVFKEVYIIVIDEPIDEFISVFKELGEYNDSIPLVENYRDIQFRFLQENIDIDRISDPVADSINGLDTELFEIDGKVEGVPNDIAYYFAFLEGKENVYMVMAWTSTEKRDLYWDIFERSTYSFKLLDQQQPAD